MATRSKNISNIPIRRWRQWRGQPHRKPRLKQSGNGRLSAVLIWDSILKLDPRHMMGNPVMFVVEWAV